MKLSRSALSGISLVAVIGNVPGCRRGPFIDSAVLVPAAPTPRPAEHPIAVYRHRLPRCPWEEVGIVRAYGGRLSRQVEGQHTPRCPRPHNPPQPIEHLL